jgi:hypothetical protein
MAQKLFSQSNPSPMRRAANFDNPTDGPPGVNSRNPNPCHPFRLHAGRSSSRNAKCQGGTNFLRERFSVFSQKRFFFMKKTRLSREVANAL